MKTDVISPSVCRSANLNAMHSIKLVWMAALRYRACPFGPVVYQSPKAASSVHNVRLPRRRKPAS